MEVKADIAPVIAKDSASNAYYNFIKSIMPPPYESADLQFSSTESFSAICHSKKTYGYRTPLASFKWVKKGSESNEELLPTVKEFLRKKHLID